MSDILPDLKGRYALRGVRVVDFTWAHAGPAATRVLADQGAEVIRIESGVPADLVGGGPNPSTPRGVGYRQVRNAGKLAMSLNMKTPQGIDVARRLVAVSDVVVDNFSRRVMPKWGMDYPSLCQIKPDIISLSMSGMGHTGIWKDYVSYGQTLQTWSGFTTLTGFPETDPCGPASAYSDATAAMCGAQAVLLALIHRARTGRGQWIDLSQFEALCSVLGALTMEMSVNTRAGVLRTGNRLSHGGGAPHGVYRCQGDERWVAIAVFTNQEWQALSQAMGGPERAQDDRFSTVTGRMGHSDELDGVVESWTSQHTPEEVMHRLQTAGVAAGVVQSGPDMVDTDPQLRERGFFVDVPDAQGKSWTIEGVPYKLFSTPGGPLQAAPKFGAHQDYVLQEVLGMSDEELAEYAVAGAFD